MIFGAHERLEALWGGGYGQRPLNQSEELGKVYFSPRDLSRAETSLMHERIASIWKATLHALLTLIMDS